MKSREKILRIPASSKEEKIVRIVDSWRGSLRDYGLEISTGPVVPFRATQHLLEKPRAFRQKSPLLWLQNVKPMRIVWPLPEFRKPQFIKVNPDSAPLLLPHKTYVLLRRFSTKEDKRRLVAAPLMEGQLCGCAIGLENHLNYIHRPNGSLSLNEAWGLAALYNSDVMDTYFRVLNGNTQVSATEVRSIPLPPLHIIEEIGCHIRALFSSDNHDLALLDKLILQAIARDF